jgi:replication-associated recombination protein RarA
MSISLLIFPVSAEGEEVNVKAKAAVLMDVSSGKVLYAMNEHERLYPASVTKIMAMLLFAEAIDSGRMTLEETVTASDVAAGKGSVPPRALQNVHFDGANSDERGQNYKYPHDYPGHYVKQQYLPNDLAGVCYYRFGENKNEQAAKAYWEKIKGVLPENKKQ